MNGPAWRESLAPPRREEAATGLHQQAQTGAPNVIRLRSRGLRENAG